jgi:hypothetical protein
MLKGLLPSYVDDPYREKIKAKELYAARSLGTKVFP